MSGAASNRRTSRVVRARSDHPGARPSGRSRAFQDRHRRELAAVPRAASRARLRRSPSTRSTVGRGNAWNECVPFLYCDIQIRKVFCSTNAIEPLNSRYRRAVRARGHFPGEQATLKCLYLVTRVLDPTGTGRAGWTVRGKPAINAFAITFSVPASFSAFVFARSDLSEF